MLSALSQSHIWFIADFNYSLSSGVKVVDLLELSEFE